MSVHRLPGAGGRLAGAAAAPRDALTLVAAAIERVDNLAVLIRRSAPSAEINAAARAVAALREPLASLRLTVDALDAALRAPAPGEVAAVRGATAGQRPYPRSRDRARLRAVPGGKDTPGGAS